MRSGPRAACNTRRRCADPFGRAPVVPAPSRPARAGASNNREPDITGSARGERRVAMVVATAREAVPPAPMPADAAGRDGCPRRRNGARSATIRDCAPALPFQASPDPFGGRRLSRWAARQALCCSRGDPRLHHSRQQDRLTGTLAGVPAYREREEPVPQQGTATMTTFIVAAAAARTRSGAEARRHIPTDPSRARR